MTRERRVVPIATASTVAQAFRDKLQSVISCISAGSNFFYRVNVPADCGDLVLNPSANLVGIAALELRATHRFQVVESDDGDLVATTLSYFYALLADGEPLVRYEHHPDDADTLWPHIHFDRGGQVADRSLGKIHFPTNRLALEQLVWLLHRDFKVPYVIPDAEAERILTVTYREHLAARTWTGRP